MNKYLVSAAAVAALTVSVAAEEVRVENNMKCTTTETGNQKTVICMSGDGPPPGQSAPQVVVGPPGSDGDVDVQVLNDGTTERRVVIVRNRMGPDSADANKDGKVSRKEFMARAEKHFAELDRNDNGTLEKEELRPPMPPLPPLPPLPGMPPMAPLPPVPPVPPVPPQN